MADSVDRTMHDVEMEVKATASGSRKRRLSQTENEGPSKRVQIDVTSADGISDNEKFNLLDFSDEVLLEILLHCNSVALQSLTKTCRRFEGLVADRRLWKSFDFSKKKMMGKEIRHLLKYVTKETKEFKVRGLVSKYPADKYKNNTLTATILSELKTKCHEMETFEVHEGFLNFEQIQLSQFPEMLKRLVFYACSIKQPRSPKVFSRIDQHLHCLEELSLERCNWFETHDLVVLSKLPHLKRLNLRGCPSLRDFVPYGSIASRFGFKSLESLDIRDTEVSDSDIQCFNITTSLRQILMECPSNLRDKSMDKNSSEAQTENDAGAGSSKETAENPPSNGNQSPESDVETGSEMDDLESEEEVEAVNGENSPNEENSNDNGSNVPQGRNHYIQVIIHDQNLPNANNGHLQAGERERAQGNALRYMVGVVNGEGPVDVLQRHLEDNQAARIRLVRRTLMHRSQPPTPPVHQGRPETREIETQTENADTVANTRQNETQTDSSPKSTKGESANSDDEENGPSTSGSASNAIGVPGPSNRSNQIVANKKEDDKAANQVAEPSPQSATEASPNANAVPENANEQRAQNAELDRLVVIQPHPLEELRQRLIIIHQRRNDGNENAGNQHRISFEINRQAQLIPYFPQLNRHQINFADAVPASHPHLVSDRGLCSFGNPRNNVQEGIVWIRAEMRPADTLLERITVRHYRAITDVTLRHLASCAPNLQYLDVTGTSVTASGVSQFTAAKPNCQVVWNGN